MQVDQDSDGNVVLECPHVEPGCLYPEEVSACVLHQLLQDAAHHTGTESISKAVITVPAYFTDEQREATVTAGTPTWPQAATPVPACWIQCCLQQQPHCGQKPTAPAVGCKAVPAFQTAAHCECCRVDLCYHTAAAAAASGKLAGLETIRLIREPVAAALAYGLNLSEDQVG